MDGAVTVAADDPRDARRAAACCVTATPAAPTPVDHDLHVLDPLVDDAQRVEQRGEHDDGRAVLVVVEDGDVERLAQPALDLEAARRRDVLEVDAPEAGAIASTVATIPSVSVVERQIGNASTPPNSLKRSALPSITGIAAPGRRRRARARRCRR